MSWVRLDDQFADHPKIMAAGPLASWLFVCGLTYCSRYLTDGFIPSAQVRKLADVDGAGQLADRLVEVGLWEPVEGGYCVHDYLDYQPSGAQRRSEQQAARERMSRRRAGEVRANTERTSGVSSPSPSPESRSPVPSSGKVDSTGRENRARGHEAVATLTPAPVATPPAPSLSPPQKTTVQRTPAPQQQQHSPPAHSSVQPDAREPPPNCDPALWTALLDGIGHAPATRAERAGWQNWLRQLSEARASPSDVTERCGVYRRRYGPDIPLTPKALAQHWSELAATTSSAGGGSSPYGLPPSPGSLTTAAVDARRAEDNRLAQEKLRLAREQLAEFAVPPRQSRQPGQPSSAQAGPAAHHVRGQPVAG